MKLNFSKQDGRWVAEFTATADFNLHIEGVNDGNVQVYQRGTSTGEYAFVRGSVQYPNYGKVYDMDFTAVVFPKYIKVSCATEPVEGVATFAE